LLRGFSVFIILPFFVRLVLISRIAGPDETKNRVGRKSSAWVQIRFRGVEFGKNPHGMSSPISHKRVHIAQYRFRTGYPFRLACVAALRRGTISLTFHA
jgi:hypothetical protein